MTVKVKAEGMRLDHYLQIFFQDFSRSELQKAIAAGQIRINGQPTKPSYKVRNDDRLLVQLSEPIHDVIIPEDIPLEVLYEDEWLAVINKPADMVVHPARGNWTGTLANALAYRFREALSRENGTIRPGIVHRLDRDTSGVILIAKDDRVHRELATQFEKRTVHKEYLALTLGELDRDSDYIEAAIKHHPRDREKMIVATDPDDPEAKPACSYYEVLERFRGYTLVKFQPRTGRTHQIRVHLLHVGCPILADRMYGGRSQLLLSDLHPSVPSDADEVLLDRQALHAFRLRFKHPRRGVWLEVEAPLPADMRRTLEQLRQYRTKRSAS
jgi:23S rRNA pseudouridine1911/1915/1917 synthase